MNYYAVSVDKNMQVKSTDRWRTEEAFVCGCQIYVVPGGEKNEGLHYGFELRQGDGEAYYCIGPSHLCGMHRQNLVYFLPPNSTAKRNATVCMYAPTSQIALFHIKAAAKCLAVIYA